MVKIQSFEEVRNRINRVRSLRKGFITNFFPEQRKIEIWTNHNLLFVEEAEEVTLFIKQDDGFKYLFYCATNKEVLNDVLCSLPSDEKYVVDQIVDARTDESIIDLFKSNGFTIRKSLVRMSKINENLENYEPDGTYKALDIDLHCIQEMLYTQFDKYSEQIPTIDELMDFQKLNHIIVYKVNADIAGFILYDKTASTIHWRYWLVNPKYRNLGIGSLLVQEFKKRAASCRRHILWVVENNENAIKRHKHYGYKFENMKDYVMCKNIQQSALGGVNI